MANSRSYDDTLKASLSDPEEAAAYLNAALEEGDPAVFLLALKEVANVHGGVAQVAQSAKLDREGMSRMLSENDNSTANSLNALLHALGLRLAIMPTNTRASAA